MEVSEGHSCSKEKICKKGSNSFNISVRRYWTELAGLMVSWKSFSIQKVMKHFFAKFHRMPTRCREAMSYINDVRFSQLTTNWNHLFYNAKNSHIFPSWKVSFHRVSVERPAQREFVGKMWTSNSVAIARCACWYRNSTWMMSEKEKKNLQWVCLDDKVNFTMLGVGSR